MLHPTEKDIHAALDYGRFLSGQDCTPEQRMISDLTKEVSRLTLAVFDREAALINKVSELERENARLREALSILISAGELLADECSDENRCEAWDEQRDVVNKLLSGSSLPNA